MRPKLRAFCFEDDLSPVEANRDGSQLVASMARLMELFSKMGARFHAKGTKRLSYSQPIPWFGFTVGAGPLLVGIS